MAEHGKFSVVHFKTGNTLEVVPSCWVTADNKSCWWPPYSKSRVLRSIKACEPVVQTTWEVFSNIRRLFHGTYEQATRECENLRYITDLSQSSDCGDSPAAPIRAASDSEDEWRDEEPNSNSLGASPGEAQRHASSRRGSLASAHFMSGSVQSDIADKLLRVNARFHKKVLGHLERQMEEIRNNREEIRHLKIMLQQKEHSSAVVIGNIEGMPQLPLQTMDEFDNMESFITEDNNFSAVVQSLRSVGGHTPKDLTRRIIRQLFSKEVASVLVYTARQPNKREFQVTKICQAVFMAVRTTYTNATNLEIREEIAKQFRQAPGDLRKRKRPEPPVGLNLQ
ncbi:uncharacterized protein LOC135371396 isoform X2 [Ornithodoros turicata]|uniref:uncharacterized protein LOC135371396 isoform X1 n=1 Tax=Ornithodoros turicata TaxID=34597 RepID=UPI003138CF2F